ncbi:lovastatin nonaketide synthase [Xylaria curta]|nr:lovastatin nonaketide synthase [Xylaria curta]
MHDQETDSRGLCPLAIVGMAFNFPQDATSQESFWEMIRQGRCASTEFPPDRLAIDSFYHPDDKRASSLPLRGGHFITEDLSTFDAPFFSITPNEAACMDPQHRKLLETAYHALEDAGIPIEKCAGSDTSVYTGCFTNDYLSILQQDYEAEQKHAAMGIAPSMLANRISWFFDFKGTSMNLDSACSSSLLALHLACQDLRMRDSSMALVGGANLVYHPNFMKIMSDFNFLSRDSRCWSFDQRANGYARGEGIAMLVIKRLNDALRDGNTIRAIIRNTGSNQDGNTPGITQPSREAQIRLIESTYRRANIDMGPTRFFEAHATGTPVGDPIEGNAIGTVFQKYRTADDPLYIGAIKANIGHLEGCSGLAGVIKSVLVLEKGVIPPIAGFNSLNSRIDSHSLHLRFPTSSLPWPVSGNRRACVNSFGFGGTNAVVILDDAYHYLQSQGLHGFHMTEGIPLSIEPSTLDRDERKLELSSSTHTKAVKAERITPILSKKPSFGYTSTTNYMDYPDPVKLDDVGYGPIIRGKIRMLVWSAHDEEALKRLLESYRKYLFGKPMNWNDISYSLVTRRSRLPWRSFALHIPTNTLSPETLIFSRPVRASGSGLRLAFVFTGQGAQYNGMGTQLLHFDVFRNSLKESDMQIRALGSTWSIMDTFRGNQQVDTDLPEYSQPMTTCLQIALVELLNSLGVTPSLVLGHSSGEIAAAYASGAISKFSAVKIAYHRGRLSARLNSAGTNAFSMMAVGMSKSRVDKYLDRLRPICESNNSPNIDIACINSPESVTVSGRTESIAQLQQLLVADDIFTRRLRVCIPYHTHFMEMISNEYITSLGSLDRGKSSNSTPMISSVSGDLTTYTELKTADYWARNLTSTVEFDAAFRKLLAMVQRQPRKQLGKIQVSDFSGISHVLEVGPHSALRGPIREIQKTLVGQNRLEYVSSLIRGEDPSISIMNAMGNLYCAGYPVDLLKASGFGDNPVPMPPDMPHYSFNHSQGHWIESSLSKNLRFRGAPRHDLLGSRSLDWNPSLAQWRNIMRTAEIPWLEDHMIGSHIVLPAAAMVAMAVEGLFQLSLDIRSLVGVLLRDVTFSRAISFPQGCRSVETQLTISQPSKSTEKPQWSQFRIFFLENNSYTECCSGLIQTVHDIRNIERTMTSGVWAEDLNMRNWIKRIREAKLGPEVDPYDIPFDYEVRYGPSFRNLQHVRLGEYGEITASILTNTWRHKDFDSSTQPFLIHPTTLDGLAQPLLHSLLAQRSGDLPTMVPTHIDRLFIASKDHDLWPEKMGLAASCKLLGYRGGYADLIATDGEDSSTPLVVMEGLKTAFISTFDSSGHYAGKNVRRLCNRLVWKQDIESMSPQQISTFCTRNRPRRSACAAQEYTQLNTAILCFISEAIQYLDKNPNMELESHLFSYEKWMRYQFDRLNRGTSLVAASEVAYYLSNDESRKKLLRDTETSSMEGYFFVQIGQHLISMLRGSLDPLHFMFHDGLADRYYEAMLGNDHHAYPALEYIDLLSFKNPSMNILEIGAGTGGQTKRLLETMTQNGIVKWARYDFTDISPSFFAQAREKLESYGKMNFQVLDISKDPTLQNFSSGFYDLIVASHVLHATDRVAESLRNVRKLLRPNGKLLLFETTYPDTIPIGFAFGLLKGWWSPLQNESRSTLSPCLDVEQWDSLLKRTGFSGVDVNIPGQEELACRYSSIMVSTALSSTSEQPRRTMKAVYLIGNSKTDSELLDARDLEAEVTTTLGLPSKFCRFSEFAGAEVDEWSLIIFLTEIDEVFLDGITESDYYNLKHVLLQAKNTLWVTRSSGPESNPSHHLAQGLGRTLMSEDPERKFVTLFLSASIRDSSHSIAVICQAAKQMLDIPVENTEDTFIEVDGELKTSRITEFAALDEIVTSTMLPYRFQDIPLSPGKRFNLRIREAGRIESLAWYEEGDENQPTIAYNEILVDIEAIGLTQRDNLVVKGQVNDRALSTDCAGRVAIAGNQSGFQIGDRVCVISKTSTAQSTIKVNASQAAIVPEHIGFLEAAAVPTPALLSYLSLFNMAHLKIGESVLIHQGTSCVGQMAIRLAQLAGARVITTTSSASNAELLRTQLSIGDAEIIDLSIAALVPQIQQMTEQRGVDIILGALSGGTLVTRTEFEACLAPFGRLVDTSLCRNQYSVVNSENFASSNAMIASICLSDLLKNREFLSQGLFQRAIEMAFDQSTRSPKPLHVFSASDAQKAFRHLDDANFIGKRVIELNHSLSLPAYTVSRPRYHFSQAATYLIGGGLGGLGRSLARWLVDRGAQYLILLSRTGVRSEAAKTLMKDLKAKGAYVVAPSVDISNLAKLKEVLREVTQGLPPIRGCIQATVALRDNLFPNMTYDDWVTGVNSKSTSSWNLHMALPSGLDFFIILSSLNGIIGGRAQANYAAGNTYKDALAHYRVSIGEKAVAIDLGLMVAEGIVAENADLLASMRRIGHLMDIEQAELMALMEYYCDPDLPLLTDDQVQILVGLETPSAIRAKKIELNHALHRPLFRQLFCMDSGPELSSDLKESINHAELLRQAPSHYEAGSLVTMWFRSKVAQVLGLKIEDVDTDRPVHTHGIDSLVAIDLKNWFLREIGADIQVFLLLSNKSLTMVAREAAGISRFTTIT